MLKRMILAAAAVCAFAVGAQAQENATIVLRSGEKVTGQLVDMGGSGFTVRVNGQDRQLGSNDVAVIDFTGSGELSGEDWSKIGEGPAIVLRNGQTVSGRLSDIGGTAPLRITVSTSTGNRDFTSSEVGRIVLSRPSSTVATSGSANTPGVPEGPGIAVVGNQNWTPTGLTVRQGERITFTATGEVRLSTDAADVAKPDGASSQRKSQTAPLPGVFAGALIARVGNGSPFPIGAQQTVTMPANGQLFLGINDDHTSDNQGGFRVNVQRQGRR
jgi:hypothetical protein